MRRKLHIAHRYPDEIKMTSSRLLKCVSLHSIPSSLLRWEKICFLFRHRKYSSNCGCNDNKQLLNGLTVLRWSWETPHTRSQEDDLLKIDYNSFQSISVFCSVSTKDPVRSSLSPQVTVDSCSLILCNLLPDRGGQCFSLPSVSDG